MDRYSKITNKNQREIVLLKAYSMRLGQMPVLRLHR